MNDNNVYSSTRKTHGHMFIKKLVTGNPTTWVYKFLLNIYIGIQ